MGRRGEGGEERGREEGEGREGMREGRGGRGRGMGRRGEGGREDGEGREEGEGVSEGRREGGGGGRGGGRGIIYYSTIVWGLRTGCVLFSILFSDIPFIVPGIFCIICRWRMLSSATNVTYSSH